ncbi:MAG: hypothetical protein ACRETQ_10590, partial [Gammaproteobacteria bacterium]
LLMSASASPSSAQVRWAIKRAQLQPQDAPAALHTHLQNLNWQRYLTELRDALPDETAERIDEREWQALRKRVEDYLIALLSKS